MYAYCLLCIYILSPWAPRRSYILRSILFVYIHIQYTVYTVCIYIYFPHARPVVQPLSTAINSPASREHGFSSRHSNRYLLSLPGSPRRKERQRGQAKSVESARCGSAEPNARLKSKVRIVDKRNMIISSLVTTDGRTSEKQVPILLLIVCLEFATILFSIITKQNNDFRLIDWLKFAHNTYMYTCIQCIVCMYCIICTTRSG